MVTLFAFLHHVAAFALVAALAAEFVLFKGELSVDNARKLLTIDSIVGASAAIVLVVGFLRVFYFEKGSDYYFHSVPFIAKITTFAAVGLLSIYPTLEFLSWRKSLRDNQAPALTASKLRNIRTILHLELVGTVVIVLCAALMARGVGHLGG